MNKKWYVKRVRTVIEWCTVEAETRESAKIWAEMTNGWKTISDESKLSAEPSKY